MIRVSSDADFRRSSRRWWAAAALLLLIGAGLETVSLFNDQSTLSGPLVVPTLAPPAAVVSQVPVVPTSAATSPPAPRSVPVTLRIPAIGVTASLTTLGLNPDRTVQVPADYQQPGWFRLGPAPGQVGSAVILGHVDDATGPAVFYRLASLKAGDTVDVSLANGTVAHFRVTSLATYLKTEFPAQQVYTSYGYSALQLVTCGGQFNTRTGHYLSNVVAYTTLISTTPARP